MSMKSPPHPGGVVKDCIEDLGLSVTDAAKVLDVTRPTLSRVINGRSAISPEMAIRLSKAFGSTPEMWLRMQTAYDLAQARKHADAINVQRYEPAQQSISL
ncbi:MAG: HigA family addiction module antidote protein [Caldilineales bacterium]|nr:HigA family addiction module antidote protein [Caldilineales bacterium]